MSNFKLFSTLISTLILIGCARYDNPNIKNPNLREKAFRKAKIECEIETYNKIPYNNRHTSGGEALYRAYLKGLAFDLCMEKKGWNRVNILKK